MNYLDYAVFSLLAGIIFIAFSALWQMYVVLSESYTLDRYKNSPNMLWIAMAVFFSFSLAMYYFCPNARKKGIVFLITGTLGVLGYGLGMWLKTKA